MKNPEQHIVKAETQEFEAIESGLKTFVVTNNGQDRQVGDEFIIREQSVKGSNKRYTGQFVTAKINYISEIERGEEIIRVFGIELNHQEDSLVLVKSTISSEDPETREKTKVEAYHTMTDPEFEKLTNQVQNKPNVSASSIGIYPSSIEKVGKDLIKEVRELVKNEKRAKATKLVAERLGIGLVPARQWIAQRVKGFN